jgi:hypothetical protein
LETLETVTGFGLLADDVQNGVDQFGTFCVVTLGPVVTSTSLAKDKVVRAEDLTEGTSTDGVQSTGFQIQQDTTRNIATTSGFVEVDVDTFELEIRVTTVSTSGVDTVFVTDDFPELGTDLVTALTWRREGRGEGGRREKERRKKDR